MFSLSVGGVGDVSKVGEIVLGGRTGGCNGLVCSCCTVGVGTGKGYMVFKILAICRTP